MANINHKITIHGSEELGKFVAELVKEGIVFEATPKQNDAGVTSYLVECNGGF